MFTAIVLHYLLFLCVQKIKSVICDLQDFTSNLPLSYERYQSNSNASSFLQINIALFAQIFQGRVRSQKILENLIRK